VAGAARPGKLIWQLGRVVGVIHETPRATSIVLDVANWRGHRAGQHVDIRRTPDGGPRAQRSYFIASAPEDDVVMITVVRLEDGELSPYLTGVVRLGDEVELRGPLGDRFVWDASLSAPLLLISAGAGIVPLRAMLRHWAAARPPVEVRVLHSARSLSDVIYLDELIRLAAFEEVDVHITLTRTWPDGWRGHRGRVNRNLLKDTAWPPQAQPRIYVCGPAAFVDATVAALIENGHQSSAISTERFGPTAG
jgi:ferredoxin-NADP reductase